MSRVLVWASDTDGGTKSTSIAAGITATQFQAIGIEKALNPSAKQDF